MGFRVRVGLFVMAALCVGGCSGGGGDWAGQTAAATSSVHAAETTQRPKGEAPAVADPLEVGELRNDPCGALSAEQLSALGVVDAGTRDVDSGNPECHWHLSTSLLHVVAISPALSDDGGLSDLYAQKQYQQYFEPTEVDGYPAVYASVLEQRSRGNCELWVGVTDELAVVIKTYFLEVEPCPVTERIATAMIEHARGGA